MAKPEWGQKRTCPGCGSRFYDLIRNPITCPNCGEAVDPTAFSKTRRSRTAPAKTVVATKATVEAKTETGESASVVDGEDDENNVLEDPSELGEDEDDVSEVVEGAEDSNVDEP